MREDVSCQEQVKNVTGHTDDQESKAKEEKFRRQIEEH